ncbi:MAG: Sulfide dehydrogenase subunit alpha precursor [Candidatus Heimdallarchaeota archaeon LC_3]|nr:MAG: Sulfide dehydrogenase subunit alpha precursor [Candidatus Heimdallarchaeota archaeon LC_3]
MSKVTTEKLKPNRRKNRIDPHILPVSEREGNFNEVNLGYISLKEVKEEANRCIQCGKPKCIEGCPVAFNVPELIKLVQDGELEKARDILYDTYCFPKSIDRICPRFCEQNCVLGKKNDPIQIMHIKRYLADNLGKPKDYNKKGKLSKYSVAIVGAGPSGLTSAFYLAKQGVKVTIFEKTAIPGGMLTLGIPEYRLPLDILLSEVKDMEKLGVKIVYGKSYGKDYTHQTLKEKGFHAVLIAHGAHKPKWMGIPGEDLEGSIHALEFLREVNLGNPVVIGEKVAVIGGGDVAIDCVRVAKRMGSDAQIFYRRAKEQMPAEKEEIQETENENIPINFLNNPVEIIGENGKIIGMKVIKMQLGEPDSSGRARPIPIEGSEYIVEIDTVIQAISQEPDVGIIKDYDFKLSKWNTFEVNEETMETNIRGVFAAGDNVSGPLTAVNAINHGHLVVKSIITFLEQLPRDQIKSKSFFSKILPFKN